MDIVERSVLDKGLVRLIDYMGSDLTVVNAARVSYAKRSAWDVDEYGQATLKPSDARLIQYLAKHWHSTPFRHCWVSFEVRAPLMVAREWWRHVIGSTTVEDATGWNEESRRYVDTEPDFYVPVEWRSRSTTNKQGSGEPLSPTVTARLTASLNELHVRSRRAYDDALAAGVAPELARLFLPAYGLYVGWYWTASLQAIAHFLTLRDSPDAQLEIREYARAVAELVTPLFPVSLQALMGSGQ